LVDRQADDFGNLKGMDGSKVEAEAEEQRHRQPRHRTDPLAGVGSGGLRSLLRTPALPTLPADFKAPTSSFGRARILLGVWGLPQPAADCQGPWPSAGSAHHPVLGERRKSCQGVTCVRRSRIPPRTHCGGAG